MQMYSNRPWQSVSDHLHSRYCVIAEIDVLEANHDPVKIHSKLQQYKKDHYDVDEKIVIYHYDIDYYTEFPYGVMIYNFLQSVRSLDISPSVFVILTSHYGLSQEIEHYWGVHCPWHDYSQDHMTVFESSYQQLQSSQTPVHTELDIEQISHAFICLCGQRRVHRELFLCQLLDLDIIQQGICSWHFSQQSGFNDRTGSTKFAAFAESVFWKLKFFRPWAKATVKDNAKYRFLKVVPPITINEDWPIDQDLVASYQRHRSFFNKNYKHNLIAGTVNQYRFNLPAIKNALLYVSIESVCQHPYPYLSEKTFKAILMKRPFVILGGPGSLAKLHDLGFRTFDQFWDESYDQETDPNQRIKQVLAITQSICQLSVSELQKLCRDMADILEYNAVHYRESYAKTQLQSRLNEL
jgi:hypothetical protein